jgi:hypothetical protein
LVIQDIKLPSRLEGALPKIDVGRLEEEAADFEASKIAKETVGTVVKMMAESRSIEPEELQEKIEKSTKMQKEFRELAKDLIVRQMGIEGGAYADIRVEGAEGLERAILNALATWQRMPKGKGKNGREREKVKITKEDIEEEEERMKKFMGVRE